MRDAAFRRTILRLAVTTWLLCAAISPGTLSADPETRYQVAWSLFHHGSIALPEQTRHTVEHDGEHFSVFFPGQSIIFLPAAAAEVAATRFGVDSRLAGLASRFVLSTFIMTGFAALAVTGLVLVLRRLAVKPGHALAGGVLLAVGTPLWIYGSAASEEATLAALAIWSFWALIDARDIAESAGQRDVPDAREASRFVNRLGVCGVLLALGLIHRSTFIAVVLGAAVIGLPLLVKGIRLIRHGCIRFTTWMLAAMVIVAIVPLYNLVRFENALDTGYTTFWEPFGGVFSTPLLTGLHGHLTSPGKGILLYVPWLLLFPFALAAAAVRRRAGLMLPAVLVTATAHLLIYSVHTAWSGEFAWGVRFHASLMPLLLIPIAMWLNGWRWSRWQRALIAALASASILVQLAGGLLNWGLEHYQHPEYYTGRWELIPDEAAWTWEGSQLRMRFVNISDKLRGEPLLPGAGRDDARYIVTVWNIFPARGAAAIDRPSIRILLWAAWVTVLLLSVVAAFLTARSWRELESRRRRDTAAGEVSTATGA